MLLDAEADVSKRLLVVSHTPHYRSNGRIVGWGPTIREIDHLAGLFGSLVHVAPLHEGPPDGSALPYDSKNVRFRPVPPAGGETLRDKLGVLTRLPSYRRAIAEELDQADAVHVRCPANISMLAVAMLAVRRFPRARWAKYAGNWGPNGREPLSYRLQRWWLRERLHQGVVTVNGRWPGQPAHITTFHNPCLTDEEYEEATSRAAAKRLEPPVRLLFVGRVEEAKGVGRAIEVVGRLRTRGLDARLDVVGDGPDRPRFEGLATRLDVRNRVCFHGWLPRPALAEFYANAHFVLLPSSGEGWPKVLSEGMAYGAVPIASAVGSIPYYLKEFGTGRAMAANDVDGFASAIAGYCSNPDSWRKDSETATRCAAVFTYGRYLSEVRELLASGDSRCAG